MRLVLLGAGRGEGYGGEVGHDIGAAVVRAAPGGGVLLELGPADGPPHVRLSLTSAEALRLSATVRGVATSGGEEILLADDSR